MTGSHNMRIRAYADLHLFFSKDEKIRYLSELSQIKRDLIDRPVDLLVIAGDLCHKAYSLDHQDVPDIFSFVSDLIEIAQRVGTQVRIIKGTSSHDAKVIETLAGMYKDEKNVKFIPEPMIEKIGELTFRWLPESYGTEKEYNEFCNSSIMKEMADITFFHGSFKCAVQDWNIEWESNMAMSFLWDENILLKNTRLFIAGGHIHDALTYYDRIFYINSYSTHSFADKPNKGYMEFIVDEDTKKWNYRRIQNKMCPEYKTIVLDNIESYDKIELRNKINQIILSINPDKTRLRIKIMGLVNQESKTNILLIKDMVKNYGIKLLPKLSSISTKEEKIDTIDYTNNNITMVDKIYELYKEKYGFITKEEIEQIIKGDKGDEI